ncbi:hypothetical protein JAAARDRAFT_149872 [Jaapia argillacea MUCL 33604]|uniref:Major facilitator superfamily (MFS) profile domain-containing protein n=1 Tax=Jaapia argillacea MUCL 33604 TaxID=933084 RepID=A0A067Q6S9_9AGAM|nr:hypothetical protein JAAARDRAFT_149872 [Jaapia argillacea MUCL 33604]
MASLNPRTSILWTDSTTTTRTTHSESRRMSLLNNGGYFSGWEEREGRGDVERQGEEAEDDGEGEYGEGEEEEEEDEEEEEEDRRTPLDRTIDRIGMGSYQWILLSLCGFGWMADNMWIQAVAIILPRVQRHFDVPDSYIGVLSSSMFGGMMFGAIGWGTCSDLIGRSAAFNLTLCFTALFGLLASYVNTFTGLCVVLFLLGSAVGGSMPTDGTLILEYIPKGKHYLVTALSVFFSFGAVVSAVVGLVIIPGNSCPRAGEEGGGEGVCDVNTQNLGWKYMLMTLGLITLSMFIARLLFFRLYESPRYLVHAGRKEEALASLKMIVKFNGSGEGEWVIGLGDVEDVRVNAKADGCASANGLGTELEGDRRGSGGYVEGGDGGGDVNTPFLAYHEDQPAYPPPSTTLFDEDTGGVHPTPSNPDGEAGLPLPSHHERQTSSTVLRTGSDESKGYSSTGESDVVLEGHTFTPLTPGLPPPTLNALMQLATPATTQSLPDGVGMARKQIPVSGLTDIFPADPSKFDSGVSPQKELPLSPNSLSRFPSTTSLPSPTPRPRRATSHSRHRASTHFHHLRRRSLSSVSMRSLQKRVSWLPRWIRKPFLAWLDRISIVLQPEWIRITVLVWAVWCCMSLAYTMFNVFLPKLLETRSGGEGVLNKGLEGNLWDVVIFTLGGCPGALLGAYLIESPLGRRRSLALSTFVTAFFCFVFAQVTSGWAVRASTVGISLSATTMWAVLYGWTPEIFDTKIRGSACGIASALSRIGGMIAPILGGSLLMVNNSLPVYTSVGVFLMAGVCVLMLRGGEGEAGMRGLMH